MKKNISFYTLGCRLNQSETAVIQRTFDDTKYNVVDFSQPADISVINTCTVTENGDADTRRLVNKAARLNDNVKIALIGCQAQVQKEKLTQLKNVKWVVGNEKKIDLANILDELYLCEEPQVITPTISRKPFTIPVAGIDEKHTRANLKIQDGCDFFCSFCEIPFARGRARSREFNDILKEAKILVEAGHKELVLTGINLGTYTADNKSFIDVINALEEIEGLSRIRISSIEPTTIPEALFDLMNRNNKLCRYLHIPLQAAHDDILKEMKRKYTLKEFDQFINQAHQTVKDLCIGTDIIVGFPGETAEQFEKSEEYLRNSPIDYFHVFSYSNRDHANSRNYQKQVSKETIQKRSKVLRDLSSRKRRLFHESLIGSTQSVLFEQIKNNQWSGLTDHYVRVFVESNKNLENTILNVKLLKVENENVIGKLVNG